MRVLYIILGLVALRVLLHNSISPLNSLSSKWRLHSHPDFDRNFSRTDANYIETSQASLSAFHLTEPYSKSYALLYMITLPYFILVGAVMFKISYPLHDWFDTEAVDLTSENMPAAFIFIGFVTSLLLASWLSYFTMNKNTRFVEWLVLHRASNGREQPDLILKRRLAQIEHDVRIRRLDVLSNFSPSEFLQSIYRRHQRYTGIAACIFLALTVGVGLLAVFT